MHFLRSQQGRKQARRNEDQSHHLIHRESWIVARFLRFYDLIAPGAADPYRAILGGELRENGVSMRRSLMSRVDLRFFLHRVFAFFPGCDACCSPPCFYTHYVWEFGSVRVE